MPYVHLSNHIIFFAFFVDSTNMKISSASETSKDLARSIAVETKKEYILDTGISQGM